MEAVVVTPAGVDDDVVTAGPVVLVLPLVGRPRASAAVLPAQVVLRDEDEDGAMSGLPMLAGAVVVLLGAGLAESTAAQTICTAAMLPLEDGGRM